MHATTAAARVTGMRALLVAKGFTWMTPRRTRVATISLVEFGLIGASVGLDGT